MLPGPPSASGALHILFVTPYVPSRLRPRPLHLIRSLARRGHRITLVCAATTARELADLPALDPYCERVQGIRIPVARSLWNCARGLAGPAPLQARYSVSPSMTAAVRRALAPPLAYDLLHVEHLRAALYGVEAAGLPRVYDAVDCMSQLLAQSAAVGPTWSSRLTANVELPRTRRFERRLVAEFDHILLTTDPERTALLALAGAPADAAERVHALPNGVDLEYFTPPRTARDPATLIFVGRMAYHANLAAARALVTDVMPRVWTQRPEARLLIVGADPPASLRTLAEPFGPRIQITGTVPDIRPYLTRATVSVNPLRYAVGIQNKVLEAMATATPVVATSAACAALRTVPGEHLLVGDDAELLASHVLGVLADPGLARRLGEAGRRYVEARHDWDAVARDLDAIYRHAIASRAAAVQGLAAAGAA